MYGTVTVNVPSPSQRSENLRSLTSTKSNSGLERISLWNNKMAAMMMAVMDGECFPQCSICCECEYGTTKENEPVLTPCGHTFCRDCVDEWLARSDRYIRVQYRTSTRK